jgi:hypothetical protein
VYVCVCECMCMCCVFVVLGCSGDEGEVKATLSLKAQVGLE